MERHVENEDDLGEDIESLRDGLEYILHLNYKGLKEVPERILQEDTYQHVRRLYMKQNCLKSLVSIYLYIFNLLYEKRSHIVKSKSKS